MKSLILLSIVFVIPVLLVSQDKNWTPDEETIGNTYYDLQTWRTMQNRINYFDDGTIGTVWNMGMDFPNFPDLGVGYNFFDGSMWGSFPTQSITSEWAINPSYTAYLEDGEMCASQGEDGLIISYREQKGTGPWVEGYFPGTAYKHPVVVTSGVDHSVIQLLYLDPDESFNSTNAQPTRGFIRYSRSTDGGQTWAPSNIILDGLGPDVYLGFTIGSYCWAEPQQDVIAFIAGDYLTDLVLMKSLDGGDTWQKTVIWEHPYPMFEIFSFDSDTFYCNDGGISIALDTENTANITFTLSRVFSSTEQDTIWYDPEVGGVVYWNEGMDTFSNNINALNPYGHPDSELIEDYNLIGWLLDINGNGQIDTLGIYSTYPTPGLLTMPQIIINEFGQIFVAFSAVTEGYNNGTANYRHIWARNSPNGEWWGNFSDLNEDLIYIFSECVYPSLASYFDSENFYLTFQEDNEPGLTDPLTTIYPENNIWFMSVFFGWNWTWVNASFIADTTVVHEGDTVYFINLSSGNPPNMINYLWTFEGGIPQTSNDTNPNVVYLNEGIYDVELTANICTIAINTKTEEDYITVLPATKINNIIKNENIEIFPNPGNGLFTINLNHVKSGDIIIDVFNILGENILHHPIEKGKDQLKLDLTSRENGIYFVQIKNGSTLITKKIAVQH